MTNREIACVLLAAMGMERSDWAHGRDVTSVEQALDEAERRVWQTVADAVRAGWNEADLLRCAEAKLRQSQNRNEETNDHKP